MATQTKEEIALARRKKRAERTLLEEQQRVSREMQKQEHLAMYKASIPQRLMAAQVLAQQLGISVSISLTETGPAVKFKEENEHDKLYIDEILTYETEEWELESLETTLAAVKAKQDACDQRRAVAQSIFNNLSDNEKACLIEHIRWLR